jgi:hypothetical protein
MGNCFTDLVYESMQILIDDLLLYADTIQDFWRRMGALFDLMARFGLKIRVRKTRLYNKSVT